MAEFRDSTYELLGACAPGHAHIAFDGSFDERDIRWDAHLMTLEHYNRLHPDTPADGRFIEIDAVSDDCANLTVCLDVRRIDHPTILKTIIMIRKYRRLRTGRHEFGRHGQH